jgi:hypothetical protein
MDTGDKGAEVLLSHVCSGHLDEIRRPHIALHPQSEQRQKVACAARTGRSRPPIPIDRDHRFRSIATRRSD